MDEIPFGKFGFIKREPMEWIKTHLTQVVTVALVILVGVVGIIYWAKADSEKDYLAADIAYERWNGKQENVLLQLQKMLKKHPQLHAKYDGAIAQKLLATSEKGLAVSYGKATLKRIGDISPYHQEFSRVSLLIAEEQLAEALERAKALKVKMENDHGFWEKKSDLVRYGCILHAYNLLRIAMLEKAAGTPAGELAAWQELKKNAGWDGETPASKTYDPEAYRLIQENFQANEISLIDYIHEREKLVLFRN